MSGFYQHYIEPHIKRGRLMNDNDVRDQLELYPMSYVEVAVVDCELCGIETPLADIYWQDDKPYCSELCLKVVGDN